MIQILQIGKYLSCAIGEDQGVERDKGQPRGHIYVIHACHHMPCGGLGSWFSLPTLCQYCLGHTACPILAAYELPGDSIVLAF